MECVVKDLTDQFKISARSIGEVAEAVNGMVSRMRTTGEVRFRGRGLSREALVNAAILYLEILPHEQRVQAINAGLRRLEALLWEAGDPPLPKEPEQRQGATTAPARHLPTASRPPEPTVQVGITPPRPGEKSSWVSARSTDEHEQQVDRAGRDATRKATKDKARARDEDEGGTTVGSGMPKGKGPKGGASNR